MTSTPLPKITPAQREALHARGLTDEEIAQLTPEERQQFIANFTPEEGQKLFNGGGGSLAPDHAAPEATQSAPHSHEGFNPPELIHTPHHPPLLPHHPLRHARPHATAHKRIHTDPQKRKDPADEGLGTEI